MASTVAFRPTRSRPLDPFGHAKASMTMDVYLNRRTINERTAEAL
jgi:hypothetical protein